MAATAKVIQLRGNPANPESAEHIIIFPGGSISVCRTSDDEYWAHVEVNRGQVLPESTRESKRGCVVDARADYDGPRPPCDLPTDGLYHVAVRIATRPEAPEGDDHG